MFEKTVTYAINCVSSCLQMCFFPSKIQFSLLSIAVNSIIKCHRLFYWTVRNCNWAVDDWMTQCRRSVEDSNNFVN